MLRQQFHGQKDTDNFASADNIGPALPTDELHDMIVSYGDAGMCKTTDDVRPDRRVASVDGDLLRRRTDLDLLQQVGGRRSAE